jgi:hypothetical protein
MKFARQFFLLTLVACTGLILSACEPSKAKAPELPTIASISVTPSTASVPITSTLPLAVTATYSDGSTLVVTSATSYSSSATSIAIVSSSGVVTALRAGTATITATVSGQSATATIAVPQAALVSIAVTPAAKTLQAGAVQQLTVTGTYNEGSQANVTAGSTFASSNPAVATIGAAGEVMGVAEGTATITATHTDSGKTAVSVITVTASGGGGGGTIVFASGYASNNRTVEGGEWGFYSGNFTDYANTFAGGGFVDGNPPVAADDSYIYLVVTTSAPTTGGYMGIFTAAPGYTIANPNAGVTLNGQDQLKIELGQAQEWFDQGDNNQLLVRLIGAEVYSNGQGGNCQIFVETQFTPTAAGLIAYTIDLSSMTLAQPCNGGGFTSGVTTLEEALAKPIGEIHVQAVFPQANTTVLAGAEYPTGLTRGAVSFETSGDEGGGGAASGNTGTCTGACIDFASASVQYDPFEGLVSAAQADDPVDGTNKVAKFVKGPTGQPWAGATVYTVALDKSVPAFDLSGSKVVTLRVYAPAAGQTVRLKLEDAGDTNVYLEQDVLTSKANEWDTLSFDFTNPINGVYDAVNTYNKVSIFPVFSVTAPPASDTTYYFDELQYTAAPAGGGVSGATGTCTAPTCTDFSSGTIGFGLFENQGGGTVEVADDPNDATNKVVKFVKMPGDSDYFGTTITGLAGPADISGDSTTITLRVFSPEAGTNFLLKLEGGSVVATTEKDAVTTVAGEWETLSFVMPDAGSYSTVVIFPHGRSAVAAETTLYIDELKFPAAGGGGESGSTGTCVAPSCTDFSAAGITFGPFENGGGGTVELASDPNDAGNDVVKFVKKVGDGDYFGTTIGGLAGPADISGGDTTITLRVWSPEAGTNFLLKLEGGSVAATTEKDAVTTQAGAWETLTFVMPDAGTYTTVVLFPHGRSAVTADTTLYIDELRFPAAGGGGPGSVVWSSNYAQVDPFNWTSAEGGAAGRYIDDSVATADWWNGVAPADATPNFYFGYGINVDAKPWGFGAFVSAPGNGSLDLSGYANAVISVWGNDELMSTGPSLTVLLRGPDVGGCAAVLQGSITVAAIGAQTYTVPLASFALQTACTYTSVAEVLAAGIAQLHIQVLGANVQYVTPADALGNYANGLNIGPITFN